MSEKKRVIRRPVRPSSERKISMNCFAAVPRGAEEITAAELRALDIQDAIVGRGGVSFVTDQAGLYRANLWLRTASRILVTLAVFPCASPEDLYAGVHAIDWQDFIRPSMTLAVDSTLRDSAITHSGFVALKAKDAVVDRIRTHCGFRPSIDTSSPDIRVNVHLANNVCTVSLDSSGDALDRRGYRLERTEAPLRETLASAVIALTGWDGAMPLADPMCGSGTIPIEAGFIAGRNEAGFIAGRMAPGHKRRFGFQRWLDFDAALWHQILADAETGIQKIPAGLITGYDQDRHALELARRNADAAGFEGQILFVHSALEDFHPEVNKGVVIMNPPYGKRLGDVEKLTDLYRQIGDVMKQRCRGWTGFVLTGNLELAKHIGLKTSRRFVLFNGPIECRLLRYELY